ncbi:hypothetical protein DICPUDRAFT_157893 [Dictyostelium purpureum]|uniref:EGF-like domain-containing protein n=1 Tax=Dictyostelium purpureum TaxID=5786 RepID=F1A0A4_DICPU|nr:uncharacterized protein DICPUDRAFT_157893 [Dictyostelium purpureum]EGC30377.1 hypothetical protein DICPUDRAFT_157893 [Dictyostelium purpureum]|eukprot:XP_003293097.1 hypothetical protein DICPUDRAFT_157893 [Dictyostelium purpureum]
MVSPLSISFEYPIKSEKLTVILSSRVEKPVLLSNLNIPLKTPFSIKPDTSSSNFLDFSLYINNDLSNTPSNPFIINQAEFVTRNIPSMANIDSRGRPLTYHLSNDFDINSFDNLSTYDNIEQLTLKGGSIPFPSSSILLNTQNALPSILDIQYDVMAPNNFIDFSGKTNINFLYFTGVSNFHINGEFPFSKLPNGINTFSFISLGLKKIPDFKIFDNTDIIKLSFSSSSMSGSLPKWEGSNNFITNLELNFNSLTGTIDESYCSLILNVGNNQMSGRIPECFTCHFNDLSFQKNFESNEFDNYNSIGTCKTIPKLKYYNQTFWNGVSKVTIPALSLMGQNIGYSTRNVVSSPQIQFNVLVKANSKINSVSYKPNRIIHKIKFTSTGQEFTLTPDPYPPLLSNITSNNHILVFKGLYYSYDITEITITIGDKSCDVTDSTFYQITCTLTTYPNQLNNVSGTLKVDQLQTTFNLNLDNNDGNEVFNNYTSCPDNCNGYICNYNTGICECPKDWTGENCFAPNHYVSSITPTYEDGGLVTMNGWFGDIHKDLNITIGNQECKIDTISSNTITCNIGAGTGKKDVIVNQNGITWKSFNFFVYQSKQQTCLNNCIDNNHGICNTSNGICECKSGWTGFDCSSPSNNNNNNNGNTNSTVNPDGSTTINNDQTTYNILITSLLELDINSDTVKQYPLQNNWNVTSNDKNGSNVTFIQILNETECQIVLSIQEIENDIQYSFAGLEFKLDKGSIKVSVSIHNYNYQSPLNTLQLQMISNVSDTTSNDCNSKSASTSTSILDNQTLNYISINKDNKILYGRFINRAISDGHTTLITTSLISNQNESVTIGINIPHCRTSCYIDPDFSVLINSNLKSNCDESKNHTTLIAVLAHVFPI